MVLVDESSSKKAVGAKAVSESAEIEPSIIKQIPLNMSLDADATFDNYLSRASARTAEWAVREVREGCYLWGGAGVGKSHLLQGLCQQAPDTRRYLPLTTLQEFPAKSLLEGIEASSLVAFDELDSVAENPAWQEPLFDAFNRCRELDVPMVFAARAAPTTYTAMLPDLRSRLSSLPVFHLPRFDDKELADLLRLRSIRRGIQMSDEVVAFLVSRGPRDPEALMMLLNALDTAALARGRPITIPLIRALKLL